MTVKTIPLTAALICEHLTPAARERFTEFSVLDTCESTNSELLGVAEPVGSYFVATRNQTAGRGRREREWVSTPGTSVAFSFSRVLRVDTRALGCVSLVAGTAVVTALRALDCDVSLKWPNDVVRVAADGGLSKAGGILVEARSLSSSEHYVVIGVGLNLLGDAQRDALVAQKIGALDLHHANAVVGVVLARMIELMDRFEREGFGVVREQWHEIDALGDATVDVIEHDRSWIARADGIDEFGRLCVIGPDGSRRCVTSAEVSVRVR